MKHLYVRARQLASSTAWRLLDRNRNLVRRTFLLLSTIPSIRRPAAIVEQTAAYAYRHGLRATFVRIRVTLKGRTPTKLGPNRDATLLTNTAVPLYDQATIHDIDPGTPLADLASTATETAQIASGAPVPGPIATEADAQIPAALRTVRLLRGLKAIEDLLGPYEMQVIEGLTRSAPLALIRTLRRNWCGDIGDARSVVETRLLETLTHHPDCPELLTELGYLLRDAGTTDEAMSTLAGFGTEQAHHPVRHRCTSKGGDRTLARCMPSAVNLNRLPLHFELAISLAPVTSATQYRYGEAKQQARPNPRYASEVTCVRAR